MSEFPLLRRGRRMELADYYADFERNFQRMRAPGFWKLERKQHFKEPGYDSWEAFARGDWSESMRILAAGRDDMERYHARLAARGLSARRIRVVEQPVTPYLQWELQALRIRDDCGGPVRILDARRVEEYERTRLLPEVYTLGEEVAYEAVYDENGILESARKIIDHAVISGCQAFIAGLFELGEPIGSYFARHAEELQPASSEAR